MATLPQARELDGRLARRRAIEASLRRNNWKRARCRLRSIRDQAAALALRAGLRIAGLYSRGVRNALAPVVRHVRLRFDNLPRCFDGFRIMHLTDLHIDGLEGLADVVADRIIRGLEVDLCAMTGDYRFRADGCCDRVYPNLRSILASVRSRYGIVAVLGNYDTSEMAVELENIGVRMLVNDAVAIAKGDSCLWVVGVDDPHRHGYDDLDSAVGSVPADAFKILLAHSPELYRASSQSGIHLYLCGHTHAGQIRLPGVGALLVNAACPRSYAQGCWRHGAMQGYTSAGVGCTLLPVRYNCAPEIAVIELRTE